jgi:hypothetical protein
LVNKPNALAASFRAPVTAERRELASLKFLDETVDTQPL